MNTVSELVSIVIPSFNQEKFIGECLDSVLSQTYTDLEIICADDCSTDSTLKIIKDYAKEDQRIKVLASDNNLGIPKNFNRAFDACTGEFVAFLGGDDIMFPDKIEKCISVLKNDLQVGMVMHDMEIFDTVNKEVRLLKSKQINKLIPEHPLHWGFTPRWFSDKQYAGVIPSACVGRSSYYLQSRYNGNFRIKHEMLFSFENYVHAPEMKWHYIPEVLGRYSIHEDNFSRTREISASIWEDNFKLYNYIKEHYPKYKDVALNALNYYMFNVLRNNWPTPGMTRKEAEHWFKIHAGWIKYMYFKLLTLSR